MTRGLEIVPGKVAVVTGGASGIGKGIASALVREGAKVVIADVEEATLARTAADLGALPIITDVSRAESVERLAREVVDRFGSIDIVCNNAGVGSIGAISDLTLDDWKWMMDINLWGVIHGVTTFLPLLKENPNGGHIVNTASLGGLACMATMGSYSVTKFGIVALSETLAIELEAEDARVGVTVLCPGTVRTNIGTSQRNRPATGKKAGLIDIDIQKSEYGVQTRWIDPEDAGEVVVRAIRRGDLYAFTHPDMRGLIDERHRRIGEALDDAERAFGMADAAVERRS